MKKFIVIKNFNSFEEKVFNNDLTLINNNLMIIDK